MLVAVAMLWALPVLGATPVRLPPGESAAAWEAAFTMADLEPAAVGTESAVLIEDRGTTWVLWARDPTGVVREVEVDEPLTPQAREDVAWLILSLRNPSPTVELGLPPRDEPRLPPGPEPEPGPGDPVVANLVEWAIEAPTEYEAGEVTFAASNGGNFPHELVVIAGESYESLPREASGAVIESELPTGALIARTARIASGETEDLVVELAPGNYVLVCNLGSGANSHAGLGQRLDVTVSG